MIRCSASVETNFEMNGSVPSEKMERIKQAIFAGRRIEAIKFYREATGAELKESKDAITKLEQELRAHSPHQFTIASSRSGCFAVFALGIAIPILWI